MINTHGIDQTSLPEAATVALLTRDAFFAMRVRTVLQQLGQPLKICKTEQELVNESAGAALVLVDFNQPVAWDQLGDVLRGDIPVVAYGAHTNVEGFRMAKAAGVRRVVSNGEMNRRLPDLIGTYGRG